jgi:tetratricopeptide (TPR) repeat protein
MVIAESGWARKRQHPLPPLVPKRTPRQATTTRGSQALHQAKAAFGDDDPRTAPYLVQMAYARQAKGDPAEALRLAERAVRVADRGSSTYQHERSEALYTRAEMRGWQNDFRNALVDAERALEIMVRLHGNGSPMTAQPAALVAYLLIFTGQPARAEKLARQVLGLVEGKGTVNQLVVASCRTTLAQAAAQQERLDEAEDQYREVLRLLESLHGSEHSLVGMRYVELGVVQRRRMHFQGAEHSLRRGLDILTKTLPPDHPSVVNARRLAGPATRVRRFMDRLGR